MNFKFQTLLVKLKVRKGRKCIKEVDKLVQTDLALD